MKNVEILKNHKAKKSEPQILPINPASSGGSRWDDSVKSNKIDAALKMIQTACDGEKHVNLRDATYLLSGYIHTGFFTENEVRSIMQNAIRDKPNVENLDAAYKTIDAAIKHGLKKSLPWPVPEASGKSNSKNQKSTEPAFVVEESSESYLERLQSLRISSASNIQQPDAIVTIDSGIISTPKNITCINGGSKNGKTGGPIAGILAGAIVSTDDVDPDCCGLTVKVNRSKKAVLHIDSEQADHNHQKLYNSIIKRSGVKQEEDYFYSFNFRQLSLKERLASTSGLLAEISEKHNGVYLIVLTGIGDFIASVNDEEAATEIVHEIELLAIKYNCPVICVLHYNPGTEKGRGHLGSSLERKCESVLSVSIKDGLSTLQAKLLRNAGNVPNIDFVYNVELGYHVSMGMLEKGAEKKIREKEIIESVKGFFDNGNVELTYSQLIEAFENAGLGKERTAKTHITNLRRSGIIIPPEKGGKNWKLWVQ